MLKDWALKSWVLKGWPCQRQMDFKSSSDRQDRSDYDSCSKQITPFTHDLDPLLLRLKPPSRVDPSRVGGCRFGALLPTT